MGRTFDRRKTVDAQAIKAGAMKRSTTVYLTEEISQRLGEYIAQKHSGMAHQRNEIILTALDRYLKSRGH